MKCILLLILFAAANFLSADIQEAQKLFDDTNYKECFELCENELSKQDCKFPGKYLGLIIESLEKLELSEQIASYVDQNLKRLPNNVNVLLIAARFYKERDHYGYIVDGNRVNEGVGDEVSFYKEDMCKSLQYYEKVLNRPDFQPSSGFYYLFVEAIRYFSEDLLKKTNWQNIGKNYDPGQGSIEYEQLPLLLKQKSPSSWKKAKNDWQRILFLYDEYTKNEPEDEDYANFAWVKFLYKNFAHEERYSSKKYFFKLLDDEVALTNYESGEKVTFKLPEQYNFVRMAKDILNSNSKSRSAAFSFLFNFYRKRDQLEKLVKLSSSFPELLSNHEKKIYEETIRKQCHFLGYHSNESSSVYIASKNVDKVKVTAYQYDLAKAWKLLKMSAQNDKLAELGKDSTSTRKHFYYEHYGRNKKLERILFHQRDVLKPVKVKEWSLDLSKKDKYHCVYSPLNVDDLGFGICLLEVEFLNGKKSYTFYRKFEMELHELDFGNNEEIVGLTCDKAIPVKNLKFESIFLHEEEEDTIPFFESIRTDNKGIFPYDMEFGSLFLFTQLENVPYIREISKSSEWPSGDNEKFEMTGSVVENWAMKYADSLKWAYATSQPIYRPGQTFKASVWFTGQTALENFPKDQKFEVVLSEDDEQVIRKGSFELLSNGRVNVEFQLPNDIKSGGYYLNFPELANPNILTFKVERYRKPEFSIAVKNVSQSEEIIELEVEAKYLTGAALSEGKIDYSIDLTTKKPLYSYVNENYWQENTATSVYSKSSFLPSWGPLPVSGKKGEALIFGSMDVDYESFEGAVSVKNGIARISIKVPEKLRFRKFYCEYNITCTNQSNREVNLSDSFEVNYSSKIPVSISANKPFYEKSENVNVSVSGICKGKLNLYKLNYRKPEKVEFILCREIKLSKSKDYLVANLEPGKYRAVVEDINGYFQAAYAFVIRGEFSENIQFRPLEMISEKELYDNGELATIILLSSFKSHPVTLFWHDKDSVLQIKEVNVDNHSAIVQIPVNLSDGNRFTVRALLADQSITYAGKVVTRAYSSSNLLKAGCSTDKPSYLPASLGEMNVHFVSKEPMVPKAKALVAIYDEALEQLVSYKAESVIDQLSHFWGKSGDWLRYVMPNNLSLSSISLCMGKALDDYRGTQNLLNVIRGASQWLNEFQNFHDAYKIFKSDSKILEEFQYFFCPEDDDWGDDECCDMGSPYKTRIVQVRRDFKDAILWKWVDLDANGQGSCQFKVPDNLTRWKVKTWCVTPDGKAGEAETSFDVNKPLMVQLQPPRFLVEKDLIEVKAIVSNTTNEKITVKSSLSAQNDHVKILGENGQNITILPSSQAVVSWQLKAVKSGDEKLKVSVLGEKLSDAAEISLPVKVYGHKVSKVFAGNLNEDTREISWNFEIPPVIKEKMAQFSLVYTSSLTGVIFEALPYLIDYPHGCVEQTTNKFIPLVLAQQLTGKFDVKGIKSAEKMADMVRAGLQRLKDLQSHGGGWSWFGSRESDLYMTAIVMNGLQQFATTQKELSYDNERMIRDGHRFLAKNIEMNPEKVGYDKMAFIAYVYSLEKVEDRKNLDKCLVMLFKKRSKLALMGKLYLALATDGKIRDELRRNIEQFLEVDKVANTRYLRTKSGYWWNYDHDQIQALYLKLLVKMEKKRSKLVPLINYLLARRQHVNYWKSTRDTALIIESLLDYLKKFPEQSADSSFDVWVNGKLAQTVKGGQFEPISGNITQLKGKFLTSGKHEMKIKGNGKGTFYLAGQAEWFSQADQLKKFGHNLTVERRFYRVVSDEKFQQKRIKLAQNDQMKPNEIIEVELLIDAKERYQYLLLADCKPAGFETVLQNSGYISGDGIYPYMDIRDDKVNFFIDSLPKGKSLVRYQIRAEHSGKVTALPAKIEAMYTPELNGGSSGRVMSVE